MEYEIYNRYHTVNNMINTLVLEGLVEGSYYRDCLVLFTSLLLDIRYRFTKETITSTSRLSSSTSSFVQQVDWLKVLTTAHVGMKETDDPPTSLSEETKKKLFVLSSSSSSSLMNEKDESIRLHFTKDDIVGNYIILNKRAYCQAIASSCALRNYDFASMLYDILVVNRIKPRKNTYFSLIGVGERVDCY